MTRDAAIIRYLSQTNTFSKIFLKLTKSKENHEKHTPHSNPNLTSSLSHFFFFYKKKESISGQNLIDNLLNFGLIKKSFYQKNLILQLAD
ncbi:MAG: hypothetical protein ACI96G_001267 [Flavobacterium sp.]